MTRFGFGEKTDESEEAGLPQFEHGHVDVSGKAIKYAIQEEPDKPPREAIGAMLVGDGDESDESEESDE